jgi:hypothetical protein
MSYTASSAFIDRCKGSAAILAALPGGIFKSRSPEEDPATRRYPYGVVTDLGNQRLRNSGSSFVEAAYFQLAVFALDPGDCVAAVAAVDLEFGPNMPEPPAMRSAGVLAFYLANDFEADDDTPGPDGERIYQWIAEVRGHATRNP